MAFPLGRGRGRGRAINQINKPGIETKANNYSSLGIATAVPSPFEELESLLTKCLKNPSQTHVEKLKTQVGCFVSGNEENNTKVIELLCSKCFADTDVAASSGQIASSLATLPDCGNAIRGALLKKIQELFKKREEQSRSDFDSYLGFLTMFCSLYKWLRANGEPLKPLTGPVYQVLDELLDGSGNSPTDREKEIETFHTCLLMVGETLESSDKVQMSELFKKVRRTILKKGSKKMRCLLLETLEYHTSGSWAANDIKAFYSDLLSDIMATTL